MDGKTRLAPHRAAGRLVGTRAHFSVLHARSEKNENKRLCFFPPLPAGTKKKGLEPKRMILPCECAVKKKERRWAAVLVSPTPGWNQSTFSVLHARSGENKNKRLCFSPPLPPGWDQGAFLCPARAH